MYNRCRGSGELFEAWTAGPRLLSGEALLHYGGGTARYYAGGGGDGVGTAGRLPAVTQPLSSWHLRYFMPAAMMLATLCRHTAPHEVVDSSEWWNHEAGHAPNATALCHQPSLIHHAITHCADLWGRAEGKGHPRQYVPSAKEVAEMPHHVTHRPELYKSDALNRLPELLHAPGVRPA